MQTEDTAKQIARWVALGALFLIPLTPLLVANSFFFPFITGKAFYFRILIEILVSAWAVLALLDKEYRPRFSWIGVVVVAFVGWMFVADAFALNAAKAFWSNFERMEGWVLLAHLLGFFVAAGAVLRAEKKWRAWFLTSLAVSLVISGYALLQLDGALAIHQGSSRIDATFGNSAYLAIYFLFNVFIAIWLALTERLAWLKWSLIGVAVLEGVLLLYTETRGAVLGLVVGLTLAAVLTLLTAGKRARYFAAWGLALVVLGAGGIYLARDTSFVQGNHVLQRVTSISLADGQTRFTIWGMAFKGVMERPLVGWGQEGFNYVFNTFYDPSLYNQEPWFDRAHNAFIDWLSAGGFPAFFLYLALFGTAIFFLWKRSELSRPERIALTSALVGYAIHNLFVFDNLYSYVYFFAILSLVHSQIGKPMERLEAYPQISQANGMTYALPLATVVGFALIWMVNVPGMQTATELITALSPAPSGFEGNLAAFKTLAANPSFAGQEVREQIVSFAANAAGDSSLSDAQKKEALILAITEMKKQVTAYPLDAREHLELSYAYHAAGDITDALAEVKTAQQLSPQKESIWIEMGMLEWARGNMQGAQENFAHAYQLGSQFPALAAYAAAGDIVIDKTDAADALLLKVYKTTTVDSDVLAAAYYHTKNWPRLIAIWKLRANQPGATVNTWLSYAASYYIAGQKTMALQILDTIATQHPEAATQVRALITQIKSGK